MPRKKFFVVKLDSYLLHATDPDRLSAYLQSMTKFKRYPYPMIARTRTRSQAYMRTKGTKPLIHKGKK